MVSSVARCWASAALPPLPKKRILPPPWMQESQASSIRRKGPPSAARVAAATAICSSNSLSNRLIAAVLHYSGESAEAAAIYSPSPRNGGEGRGERVSPTASPRIGNEEGSVTQPAKAASKKSARRR